MNTQKLNAAVNQNQGGNNPTPDSPPNNPEKNIPVKKDDDNDFTKIKPGVNEPEKIDPTRIEVPGKNDPTRIDIPPQTNK